MSILLFFTEYDDPQRRVVSRTGGATAAMGGGGSVEVEVTPVPAHFGPQRSVTVTPGSSTDTTSAHFAKDADEQTITHWGGFMLAVGAGLDVWTGTRYCWAIGLGVGLARGYYRVISRRLR